MKKDTHSCTTRVTYEKRLTICRKDRVDRRSGHRKLKKIVFDLRQKGYKDEDAIPYEDVEDSIYQICGLDERTVKK